MKKIIKNNVQMLSYIWKHEKSIFIVAIIFCLCDVITPFQDTYIPKLIIDKLPYAKKVTDLSFLIILFVGISLYKVIVYPLYKSYFSPLAKTKVSNALNEEMIEKTKSLDLRCFESKEFYDKYTRALNELDARAYNTFETLVSFVRYICYMSVLIGVITVLDPILLLLGAGCSLFSFFCNKKIAETNYQFRQEITTSQRKCDYAKRILYLPEYAKETRFYPIAQLAKHKYMISGQDKVEQYKKNGRRITMLSIVPEFITTLILHGIVLVYLIWNIIYGQLTAGDFIALLLATSQFSNQLVGFGDQLTKFYENSLYVDNLNAIFNYKPVVEQRITEKKIGEFKNLTFHNVSFSYEGEAKQAIKQLNMSINRGEKIAIVGLNGSGKSTLIKLLLNLYFPTSGSITLNGENIQQYSTKEYRSLFGVLFQDYNRMSYSIAENILFHEPTHEEKKNLMSTFKQLGISKKIEALKVGVDTPITKELSDDGSMFSGGELQLIMLARLFFKAYDILILDEPTSALDPYAEYNLYNELISKKRSNQTMIMISHRLLTTKDVDKIYYMENGMILETGSHNELIELNGKYASLYNIQNNYYLYEQQTQNFKEGLDTEEK